MNVYEDLPQVPQLLFPNDDLIGVSQTPIFDWVDEESANSFTLYLASDSAFTANYRLCVKYSRVYIFLWSIT